MPQPKENFYTASEYYDYVAKLPENVLTELIDGQIVNMASPSIIHQTIVTEVATEINIYIRKNKGKCSVKVAPTDVQIDDRNVVIPDIFIACNPDKFDKQKYNGSPDFIIEVVSGNYKDDYVRKLALYEKSGVREYWIVDPKKERVVVYFFEETDCINIFTFNDDIPVGIYKNNPVPLILNIAELIK